MTPVFQDRFGRGNGNCMQAAIASLLDLPLAVVPNFSDAEDKWFEEICAWAETRSLGVVHVGTPSNGAFVANGALGVGIWTVETTEERHAVVMQFVASPLGDGRWKWESLVAHDPNPKTPELVALEEVIFFLKNDFLWPTISTT